MVMSLLTRPKKSVATITVAADGTGDTTDIQTGINMLPIGGGVVYIREGTYNITTSITIPNDGVEIIGAGRSTIIQTTQDIPIIYAINVNYISLHLLHLIGANNALYVNNWGIEWATVTNSFISDCWVEDCTPGGIILYDSSHYCMINGNNCYNNGSLITHGGIILLESGNCTIFGNICNSNSNGMIISDSDFSSITTNICSTNVFNGIYFYSGGGCTISGNTCTFNLVSGMSLLSTYDGAFSNNICDYNILNGIDITSSYMNLLTGNICNDNNDNGIHLISDNGGNVITSNSYNENLNYGILIDNLSNENIINENYTLNNGVGSISDLGANNQLFNNMEL